MVALSAVILPGAARPHHGWPARLPKGLGTQSVATAAALYGAPPSTAPARLNRCAKKEINTAGPWPSLQHQFHRGLCGVIRIGD